MPDDPTPVQTGKEPKPSAATETDGGTGAPRRRPVSWMPLIALGAMGLLLLLQAAGLLLRDALEERIPRLAEAPAELIEGEDAPLAPGEGGARFGPGVREVVVAGESPRTPPSAPSPPSPPPSPPPAAAPPAEPTAQATSPATAPPSQHPNEPAVPTPSTRPAPSAGSSPSDQATHALQVGIFRSQRYRHEMEQRLEAAGLPHFHRERLREGTGYRLTLTVDDPATRLRAREALETGGYVYTETPQEVRAAFHFEEEAQQALTHLAAEGLRGGYTRVEAPLPVWTVFAGPFDEDAALQAQQRLATMGLPSYVRTIE